MEKPCCNKCAGEQLVITASSLAAAISQNLEIDQVETLSSFFTVLGDSLDAIAIQHDIYERNCTNLQTNNTTTSATPATT